MESKVGSEIKTAQEKMGDWQEEMKAQVGSLTSRIDANQKEMKAMLDASLEKMGVNPAEMQSVAVHQEVPKEEATMETIRALKDVAWRLVSSLRAPPTAKEMDPGRWCVPAEVGCYLRMVDSLCLSCTAQKTWPSWTMLYAGHLKYRHLRRNDGRSQNAAME
jgi:uncharacterized FlaG/YvyC family protein